MPQDWSRTFPMMKTEANNMSNSLTQICFTCKAIETITIQQTLPLMGGHWRHCKIILSLWSRICTKKMRTSSTILIKILLQILIRTIIKHKTQNPLHLFNSQVATNSQQSMKWVSRQQLGILLSNLLSKDSCCLDLPSTLTMMQLDLRVLHLGGTIMTLMQSQNSSSLESWPQRKLTSSISCYELSQGQGKPADTENSLSNIRLKAEFNRLRECNAIMLICGWLDEVNVHNTIKLYFRSNLWDEKSKQERSKMYTHEMAYQ